MDKIKKEIKLFSLLEKLKKRDLYNHLNNVNLLNEELERTNLNEKENRFMQQQYHYEIPIETQKHQMCHKNII